MSWPWQPISLEATLCCNRCEVRRETSLAKTNPEAQQMIGRKHSKRPLYVAFDAEGRARKRDALSLASASDAQRHCINSSHGSRHSLALNHDYLIMKATATHRSVAKVSDSGLPVTGQQA